jgi:predicted RNA polymerase sigma factor
MGELLLTLRTLARLTNAEIAHAFLIPEDTLAQRLVERALARTENAAERAFRRRRLAQLV